MTTETPFENLLVRYAEVIVRVGVNLQPGQRLLMRSPLEAAPLARAVVVAAYQAGARLVDVMWGDDQVTLARFQHAPRDSFAEFATWRTEALAKCAAAGDAFVSIYAEDPDLLREQDPALVKLAKMTAQKHHRAYYDLLEQSRFNWCAVSAPIPAWARRVFPEAPDEATAMAKLWEAILRVSRADQADPVAAWDTHVKVLSEKKDQLTARQYRALRYRGPGTDLAVGLPPGHLWLGGNITRADGLPFVANLPTEEVFTLPHRERVDGVVTCSRPLSYSGVLIEGFGLRFEKGLVVESWAEKGHEALKGLLDIDEGSRRLGEVALVPHHSPVSESGILFYNTLFDENAASHLALGRAYQFSLKGGTTMSHEAFRAAGGNDSLSHVDFMIGSEALDVDGERADGTFEPILRKGDWAL